MRVLSVMILIALLGNCQYSQNNGRQDDRIVINEFMAANRGESVTDEGGDADDWFELYNSGSEVCATGALFCTDDSTRLDRYPLPDTLLPPGGFLLIWADDDKEQGQWHAPFKLSAEDGEEIILSDDAGRIIDRVQFFPHNNNPVARVPDESYGRVTDGDTLWVQQFTPSPGASNSGGRR